VLARENGERRTENRDGERKSADLARDEEQRRRRSTSRVRTERSACGCGLVELGFRLGVNVCRVMKTEEN